MTRFKPFMYTAKKILCSSLFVLDSTHEKFDVLKKAGNKLTKKNPKQCMDHACAYLNYFSKKEVLIHKPSTKIDAVRQTALPLLNLWINLSEIHLRSS